MLKMINTSMGMCDPIHGEPVEAEADPLSAFLRYVHPDDTDVSCGAIVLNSHQQAMPARPRIIIV